MRNILIFAALFFFLGLSISIRREDLKLLVVLGVALVAFSVIVISAAPIIGGVSYTLEDIFFVRRFPLGSLGFYLGYAALFVVVGAAIRWLFGKRE